MRVVLWNQGLFPAASFEAVFVGLSWKTAGTESVVSARSIALLILEWDGLAFS